jgi:Zinc dependent phospholipase C
MTFAFTGLFGKEKQMAGPYVHCMVTREALKKIYSDTLLNRYRPITNPGENAPYFPYVCLGSVSPDYPYPALRIEKINSRTDENGWTWGDKFHKQNTGSFIDIGLQELRGIADKTRSDFLKKAAWLMGYYSHIITDLVVHAVVYKLVDGCYETHKDIHLHCEIVQDSLLFYDVYKNPPQELVDVHFLKILQKCQEVSAPTLDPNQPTSYVLDKAVEDLWDFILRENYSGFYTTETPQLDVWHRQYSFLMKVGTAIAARTVAPGTAYQRTPDIAANEPANKAKYYTDMTLPGGTPHNNYRDKVFNKAVDEVANKLRDFLNSLDNTSSYLALRKKLEDWNLDKGTIGDDNPKFALWDDHTEYPFNCPGDPPQKGV